MRKKNNNNNNDQPISYYSSLKYARVDDLSRVALPRSLNEYFEPFIENIKDCLLFLQRFSEEDDNIKKLLKAYSKQDSSKTIDLDRLAEDADFTKGELRRLLHATLDLLEDEEALMLLRTTKPHIVKKSIEVALTDAHPDSYEERKSLMQFYGIYALPKNASVQVNIDKSQTLSLSNTQVGLPSFATTIQESERIASQEIKALIEASESSKEEDEEGDDDDE